MFSNVDSKKFDAAIVELMEINRAQEEEIRYLKMEQESQAMMLCGITKQKKRVVEDRAMLEDDKRNLTNIIEEKSTKLTKISNMHLDTLSQMMNAHHELNMKDIEISTLKMQNELRREGDRKKL